MKTHSTSTILSTRRIITAVVGLALAGSLGGCFALAAGAGAGAAVAYEKGDLDSTLPAGLAETIRATQAALGQLNYATVNLNQDANNAYFLVRTDADKKVNITLKSLGAEATRVEVRVGTFGNQEMSVAILDQIRHQLPPVR